MPRVNIDEWGSNVQDYTYKQRSSKFFEETPKVKYIDHEFQNSIRTGSERIDKTPTMAYQDDIERQKEVVTFRYKAITPKSDGFNVKPPSSTDIINSMNESRIKNYYHAKQNHYNDIEFEENMQRIFTRTPFQEFETNVANLFSTINKSGIMTQDKRTMLEEKIKKGDGTPPPPEEIVNDPDLYKWFLNWVDYIYQQEGSILYNSVRDFLMAFCSDIINYLNSLARQIPDIIKRFLMRGRGVQRPRDEPRSRTGGDPPGGGGGPGGPGPGPGPGGGGGGLPQTQTGHNLSNTTPGATLPGTIPQPIIPQPKQPSMAEPATTTTTTTQSTIPPSEIDSEKLIAGIATLTMARNIFITVVLGGAMSVLAYKRANPNRQPNMQQVARNIPAQFANGVRDITQRTRNVRDVVQYLLANYGTRFLDAIRQGYYGDIGDNNDIINYLENFERIGLVPENELREIQGRQETQTDVVIAENVPQIFTRISDTFRRLAGLDIVDEIAYNQLRQLKSDILHNMDRLSKKERQSLQQMLKRTDSDGIQYRDFPADKFLKEYIIEMSSFKGEGIISEAEKNNLLRIINDVVKKIQEGVKKTTTQEDDDFDPRLVDINTRKFIEFFKQYLQSSETSNFDLFKRDLMENIEELPRTLKFAVDEMSGRRSMDSIDWLKGIFDILDRQKKVSLEDEILVNQLYNQIRG